jgi:hypothetical protein
VHDEHSEGKGHSCYKKTENKRGHGHSCTEVFELKLKYLSDKEKYQNLDQRKVSKYLKALLFVVYEIQFNYLNGCYNQMTLLVVCHCRVGLVVIQYYTKTLSLH